MTIKDCLNETITKCESIQKESRIPFLTSVMFVAFYLFENEYITLDEYQFITKHAMIQLTE